MNPMDMIRGMFRKHPSKALAAQIGAKFNQPMLMHPTIGRDLVASYLDAEQFFPGFFDDEPGSIYEVSDNVAVIDIAGALLARESDSFFSYGMMSYEGIRDAFQELLDDPAIDTIVGRFDSPGGMAAQNMDLSDFIYASRGQGTRLIAMVDDMAYSAAFGIASAFEEIWVTRTSGVGSVGVVSYHVDRSELDKKLGISVKFIYAGDKKVLGNPHEPLSDDAQQEYQKEVDRLYNLFSATVARNLGMSVEDVKATQAGTFHGEEAIEVGFATRLGTFAELMQSLSIEIEDDKEDELMNTRTDVATDDQAPVAATPASTENEDAPGTEVTTGDEGSPDTSADVTGGADEPAASTDEAEATAAARSAGIRALCTAAGRSEAADDYIASGMELGEVRETLLALTSTNEATIITSASASPSAIRKDDGWAEAFAKAQKY